MSKSISLQRLLMILLMLFAGVALMLAVIGIFGVFSYSVSQRRREIGIRLAVGATGKNVFRMVVRQAMKLAVAGIFIGIVAAMLATRFIETLLYEVRRTDLNNFVFASIILLAAALLACLVPAYRAMKVDPMISLRSE